MVFSSLTFLLYFLPIVLLLYFVRSGIRWRNGVLLAASLFFYAWGEPIWILAMVASTAVNFLCARGIARSRRASQRKLMLTLGVGVSAAFLFGFKYAAFFVNSVLAIFSPSTRIASPELPIGISFYTFQLITYTVDVYRRKMPPLKRFSRLLLYVSCFPQLIAGPIVQYGDIAAQLGRRTSTADGFAEGMQRMVIGLSKKVLLANLCGSIVEALPHAGAAAQSVGGAWYMAFMYALQIYFDFSGYSDMAIGLGRIFGFGYKENFNYPYISDSPRDFWRRWHISLGSFFRDYVYIPLGGNRRGKGRTILNTLAVWTLTGLWHGANWTFLLWGLYYGILLTIDLLGGKKLMAVLPKVIARIVTLALVLVGWMLFYYTSVGASFGHIGAMLGIGAGGLMDKTSLTVLRTYSFFPIIAFIAAMPVAGALKARLCPNGVMTRRVELMKNVWLTICLLLSVLFLVGQSYNPFIYFQF